MRKCRERLLSTTSFIRNTFFYPFYHENIFWKVVVSQFALTSILKQPFHLQKHVGHIQHWIFRICRNVYISTTGVPMGNKQWGAPTHEVTWFFHCVILWDHEKNWQHYISTISVLIANQTWQHSKLSWWVPTHKSTWPFDKMFLRGHVTNLNHFISPTIVPTATKLGSMVVYLEELLSIKSYNT